MRIARLDHAQLSEAELVLADACAFDRATEVAEEKLFGPGPTTTPLAFGAWRERELVGVAAVAGRWLRVLAVIPGARGRGTGSALLAACEDAARATGETQLRTLDEPGNYLAPGIDARNEHAIAWLERKGYARTGDPRTNILVPVRHNPRVTAARAGELAATAAATHGVEIRRARRDEQPLLAAIAAEFGGAWPFEVERALGHDPAPGVHVAIHDQTYCAFAAHDGNNRGLGWFGPTGTWPAYRGRGLGEALLVACLVDVAAEHAHCEVAWIGPRPFYEKVAGISSDRELVVLRRTL